MSFSLSKREKIMALIFAIGLFIFIFIKLVLMSAMPDILASKLEIDSLKSQMAELDKDSANMPALRADYQAKQLGNERLGNYLMDNASIMDSVEYVNMLAKLFGEDIMKANVTSPSERTASTQTAVQTTNQTADQITPSAIQTGSKFYEFDIGFSCNMTYSEIMTLVRFIEGGTRKVKIKDFSISTSNSSKPLAIKGQNAASAAITANISGKAESSYSANFTIAFYAMNIGSLDKMYEFSKTRFNRYESGNSLSFVTNDGTVGSVAASNSNEPPVVANTVDDSYLLIKVESVLKAGSNVQISGKDKPYTVIWIPTKENVNVDLLLNGLNYTVKTTDANKKTQTFSGNLPKGNFTIGINIDFPQIPDNLNLGLNLKITNNTNQNINIVLKDDMKKAVITNRDSKVINLKDDKEHVNIL